LRIANRTVSYEKPPLIIAEIGINHVGNSSAGVREAPFFALPSLDIGTRQNLRNQSPSISNATAFETKKISDFLNKQWGKKYDPDISFGIGNSSANFKRILS
jgi:UDP-N-acetylglucosamine 2-epimerase (hydrolysing)